MTVAELLPELNRRGVELTAVGDRLHYRAPRGTLTSELREAVVRFRGEILDLLHDDRPGGQVSQDSSVAQVEMPSVEARVRGRGEVAKSANSEPCWHCKADGSCGCALCSIPGPAKRWEKGQCRACLGSGHLTWGVSIH